MKLTKLDKIKKMCIMIYEMLNKYKKKKIEKLKIKARKLYKQGLTLREIGKILNKSHQWVYMAIKNEKQVTN